VVIVQKSFLSVIEPDEIGGGIVDRVFPENYFFTKKSHDREEAGSPNILGAINLVVAIHILDLIGIEFVLEEDMEITNYCPNQMLERDEMVIYGDYMHKDFLFSSKDYFSLTDTIERAIL